MGSRNLAHPRTVDREVVQIFGGGTGAGDADMTSVVGPGVASIAYASAAGKFTVTLQDAWAALLWVGITVVDPDNTDGWTYNIVSESITSKTFVIQFLLNEVPTSPTTDEKVKLMIVVSNTKVPAGRARS